MPDFWTHIIAGQEMIEKSDNKKLIDIFARNTEIFNLGCQGPDFFFYSDFWPWIKDKNGVEVGEKLHQEKTVPLIVESLKYLRQIKNNKKHESVIFEKLLTYITGFIAHYALDFKTHPLIFEYGGSGNSHKKLEMELDLKIMEEKWHLNAENLSPIKAIDLGNKLPIFIVDYYLYIFNKIFSINKNKTDINSSYNDFKKFHKIFYSPQRVKSSLIQFIDSFISMDIALYSYKENNQFHLLQEDIYYRFKDKYNEGIGEGIRLYRIIFAFLNNLISEKDLKNQFENKNFTGKKPTS